MMTCVWITQEKYKYLSKTGFRFILELETGDSVLEYVWKND